MDAVHHYSEYQPREDIENMDKWKKLMAKETPKLYYRASQQPVSNYFIPTRQLY
jgi:hypothetical protein